MLSVRRTMRKSVLTNLAIMALTVALVAGAFASFQRKRSSFERIDFTFTRRNGVIVVKTVDPDSGAQQAGLRPGDEIWLIGDTPSNEVEGLQKTLRRIAQSVPMVIVRDGHALKLTYRVPELKIDYPYLILSFIGFLYLAIGLFTLFRGERRESTLFYFITLLYIPPTLLALWDIDLLIFNNRAAIASAFRSLEVIQRWEIAHFAIYFTLAVVALAYTYRTAAAVGRKQIKWIYLGMVLGFLPFLLVYIVPWFVVGSVKPIYSTMSILPLALIPLAFAVSILKYKLWDVEVVIKEVLAYSITFAFGMIAFSNVNLILSHVIEEQSALERNFLAFTSGLVIAGVLIPVKGRIESVIDMFVYRESYKHRRAMAEFGQELATFHDVHELISMMRA